MPKRLLSRGGTRKGEEGEKLRGQKEDRRERQRMIIISILDKRVEKEENGRKRGQGGKGREEEDAREEAGLAEGTENGPRRKRSLRGSASQTKKPVSVPQAMQEKSWLNLKSGQCSAQWRYKLNG